MFSPEGTLKIVDRKKDVINVSGFKVYPNEVEAVAAGLCRHRRMRLRRHARRRAREKQSGCSWPNGRARTPSEADVIAHCRLGLAAYKVPKQVCFLDALPKSTVGKILRKDLRVL